MSAPRRRRPLRVQCRTGEGQSGPKEVQVEDLRAVVQRARVEKLSEAEATQLDAAIETLAFLTAQLAAKGASIARLRAMMFGPKSEKTDRILSKLLAGTGTEEPGSGSDQATTTVAEPDAAASPATGGSSSTPPAAEPGQPPAPAPRPKRKGHGRNGAAAYHGATRVPVPHESLTHGTNCPCCQKGKVYRQHDPAKLIRVTGMAPLSASVYELDRLRCNLCGEVFTAATPDGVGEEKYDESAVAMVGTLKYGTGTPFNRLEKLQGNLGIPLPAATQWELVDDAADTLEPVHGELIRQGAQGEVLHNDDTRAKILELEALHRDELAADTANDGTTKTSKAKPKKSREVPIEERTAAHTTAIVAAADEHPIALFFTGQKHAGENMQDVLAKRAAELPPPIQMCDALSHNTDGEFKTILANCLAHARRHFVSEVDTFPVEVRHILETLRDVFHNDALARQQGLTPEQRLRFHQEESGPKMDELEKWLKNQLDDRKVEPNSGLGEAIRYMQRHWAKLTLFLRVPGAPLDNNICERAIKKAILHRKNALFYKTRRGAHVGDVFMTLIHTAEMNGVDPFRYLHQLLLHPQEVKAKPGDWMPWNYQQTLDKLPAR